MMAAVVLAVALLLPCALADIKVEGWREQRYDYVITNIGDFPDYLFLTSSAIWGWDDTRILNSTGSFGGGYKLDAFIVHAVPASNFDQQRFYRQAEVDTQESMNCTDYCQSNAFTVSSNLSLPKATQVQETVPLEKIEVHLKIDSITAQALGLSKTEMLYYYSNGTIQEMPPESS